MGPSLASTTTQPCTRTGRRGSTSASTPPGTTPPSTAAAIGWARSTWDALAPFATGGVYLNFAGLGEDGNLRAAALGGHEARLDQIRGTYDPDGLFAAAALRP